MSDEPQSTTDWQQFAKSYLSCSGVADCAAEIHLHGCFADVPPARCNLPEEHDG